jgi:uncharacterized membrane protein
VETNGLTLRFIAVVAPVLALLAGGMGFLCYDSACLRCRLLVAAATGLPVLAGCVVSYGLWRLVHSRRPGREAGSAPGAGAGRHGGV